MKCVTTIFFFITSIIAQDTLMLKSGMMYLGKVMGVSNTSVNFQLKDGYGAQQVQLKTVSKIIKSNSEILYDSESGITSFKTEQVAEITYEQTQDIEFAKNVSNMTNYNSYLTKDGTFLKLGDTLVVGFPATGDKQYTKYIGTKEVFSTIELGGMGMTILAGPNYLDASSRGVEFTIEKISVNHTKLSKKSTLNVGITARDPGIPKLLNKRTIGDLERSLLLGEIISPNAPMTREEAIQKLKESKDLLDLEIISQDEYDALKEDLTPIIRGD